MSERTATGLVFVGGLVMTCVGVLGLSALGANAETVFLGFLVPLALSSVAISRVTMHYAKLRGRSED